MKNNKVKNVLAEMYSDIVRTGMGEVTLDEIESILHKNPKEVSYSAQ
jgi:hypothetical protein